MKKKHLFQIIILSSVVLITVSILLFSNFNIKIRKVFSVPEEALLEPFISSGANHVNNEIYFNAILNNKYEKKEYLERLLMDIYKALEIEEMPFNVFENDLMKKMEFNGAADNDENVAIIVEFLKEKSSDNIEDIYKEINLSLDLTGEFSYYRLPPIRKAIEAVFKKHKVKATINSCITGSFQGKMSYIRMNEICKNIFDTAGANKVGNYARQNFISVSAYTPLISNFITNDGYKSNIDIEIRYNDYEQKTYIWLATPGSH